VVLLHSCGLDVLRQGEALAALVRAQEAGKIRFVGYSGDNEVAVYAAGLPEIAVIETSLNITDQANLAGVLVEARQRNLGIIAKRPIANSAWKPLSDQQGMYASYAKTYTERFQAMELSLADLGLSGDPALVWPQVALRFTLSQPGVHTAIVGTCRLAHAEANLGAAALGPLPETTAAVLRAAFTKAESASGEAWLAQT
jgi:aryl-alcohol dehydrogenase-like predicted oxidoreductase